MKLNEQQLAQLFKQDNAQSIDVDVECLLNSTDASIKRIKDVEQIANNSQLSASYQVINQLQHWSINVSKDFNNGLSKTSLFNSLFSWLKPTLTATAIAAGVYFVMPMFNTEVDTIQSRPDQMMFSGSFEKGKQQVLPIKPKLKSDVIYKGDFG